MRNRLTLGLLALGLTACMSTLEAVAPRAFYGRLVRVDDAQLCLADPRDDEPDGQRCFLHDDVELPAGTQEGDILAVRYELAADGDEATVISIAPVASR